MDARPDQSATGLLVTSLFVELLNPYMLLNDAVGGSSRAEGGHRPGTSSFILQDPETHFLLESFFGL